jgi:hypothetical protein
VRPRCGIEEIKEDKLWYNFCLQRQHHPAVLDIPTENLMKKLATLLVAAALMSPMFAQAPAAPAAPAAAVTPVPVKKVVKKKVVKKTTATETAPAATAPAPVVKKKVVKPVVAPVQP